MMFKKLLPFLFLCFGFSTAFAQNIKYRSVNNEDLVYVLNNIEKTIEFTNDNQTLYIKVFVVSDPSGSANIPETDEITNTIYIATSEDGEAPEQHVYKLTSVYDPKIISWTKSSKQPQLVFSYGPADKRKKVTVSIALKQLQIKQV
ncbi:MAG: hypothetical protein JO080_03015 [Mucilaginibacter sp.]|nr:hypothetical protein [Mucilaginibacter sp.]